MQAKSILRFGRFVIIICLLSHNQLLTSQPKQKDYLGMEYSKWMLFSSGDESVAPFYISSKPVTNKEYILFLAWTARVYVDYPEELLELLPGIDPSAWNAGYPNPFADSLSFRYYIVHSESFVSEYIFNPLYLNAAVIGVNWEQANKFCHWLSDRYNEYCLINKGYLMENPNQINEDNFSTEAFLFRQYEGVWGKMGVDEFFPGSDKKGFDFVNYLLRPSFHIATQYELLSASKSLKLVDCYCTEAKGSEFLDIFYKYYLPEHKGYIFMVQSDYDDNSFYLVSGSDLKTVDLPEKATEWFLDSYLSPGNKSVKEIYKGYGYDTARFVNMTKTENFDLVPQKNKFGLMDYLMTGESENMEIEMVKSPVSPKVNDKSVTYLFDHSSQTVVTRTGDRFTTFRVAVNAVKRPVTK